MGVTGVIEWFPACTMPFGTPVLLLFASGEKGAGEIDHNWVYPDGDWDMPVDDEAAWAAWTLSTVDESRGLTYWTAGGPNGGTDFERDERPIAWAKPDMVITKGLIEHFKNWVG